MNVLLFDIGGTGVKYAVGDEQGNLEEAGLFPTPSADIQALLAAMDSVRLKADRGREIHGVAVSCPGAVDPGAGIVHGRSAVPCIHGIPFLEMLSRLFGGLPVSIENDARCFAWGELWKGAGTDRHCNEPDSRLLPGSREREGPKGGQNSRPDV